MSTSTPRPDPWASGPAYEGYVGRWSRLVAPEFLAWLDVEPDRRWLDVGCGTGMLTRAILADAAPRWVVGVDPSAAFLDHAREVTDDRRATFRAGSAAETGAADGSVDVVVAGLVLNFVPDLAVALAEAMRVVRPGGLVAGYVWDYAEGMQFMRHFWDAATALDPAAAERDEGRRFSITNEGALAEAFRDAGFEAVADRPIVIPTRFADFDDYWVPFTRGTGPGPGYVASLEPGARDALAERIRSTLPTDPDGSIPLTARTWAVRGRRPAG